LVEGLLRLLRRSDREGLGAAGVRQVVLAGALLAMATVAAACSSPAHTGSATPSASPPPGSPTRGQGSPSPPAGQGPAVPGTGSRTPLTLLTGYTAYGTIVETGSGFTVYAFSADTPASSNCAGVCAAMWRPVAPPVAPHYAVGILPGLVASITRADGSRQLTYGGHPLYTYRADQAPGHIDGQAVSSYGGTWLVVSTSGQPATVPSRQPGAPPGGA
jgi:predicted lipoprotein with Yx(FWY)xxD motif